MKNESKLWAFVAMFLSIIGVALVYVLKKKDDYAVHYAKQSFVLFVFGIIVSVAGWVPIIGWIASSFGTIIMLALWIIGLIYTLSGKKNELPLIGKFAEKL